MRRSIYANDVKLATPFQVVSERAVEHIELLEPVELRELVEISADDFVFGRYFPVIFGTTLRAHSAADAALFRRCVQICGDERDPLDLF